MKAPYVSFNGYMWINIKAGAHGNVLYSSAKHGWREIRRLNSKPYCDDLKKKGWRVRPVRVEEEGK